MEERLQHQPTALEPQRAHTNRVCSTPQGGAKLEQTLLMIEGKLGSRSAVPSVKFGVERGPPAVEPPPVQSQTQPAQRSTRLSEDMAADALATPLKPWLARPFAFANARELIDIGQMPLW